MLRPFTQEEITVTDTATGLTVATYAATGWGNAQRAIVQVLNASVRIRTDGTTVTNSTGFAESPGSSFELTSEAEIVNFSAIRVGSNSAKLIVTYYRKM